MCRWQDAAEPSTALRLVSGGYGCNLSNFDLWGLPWGSLVVTNSDSGASSEYVVRLSGEIGPPGQERKANRALGGILKRSLDICVAGSFLVLFAPLLLLVAAAVWRTSSGPVLFGHSRIGHGGKPFRCWKFRTMVVDGETVLAAHFARNPDARTEWDATRKLKHDPRVTPLGRVLRAYSVDELPQLFNVLSGEMSLVGPRPVVAEELERYGPAVSAYLSARPGITGLWQTSGRSDASYGQRIALDSRYAAEWSFALDLWILLRTIPVVLGARGAC